MNPRSHLSLSLLLVSSLVGLEGLSSGCEGSIGPDTLDSGMEAGHDGSAKPDSGIGSGGGGQCAAIGAPCPTFAELQADGGTIFEQTACCGSAVCALIPCCYSACESFCTAPADLCCSSGGPCGNDDQCCSGTCLHADAGPVPPNLPGGSCM
jgi:hypothetical protein